MFRAAGAVSVRAGLPNPLPSAWLQTHFPAPGDPMRSENALGAKMLWARKCSGRTEYALEERIVKRAKSPRQVQRFPSAYDQIARVFARRPNKASPQRFYSAPNPPGRGRGQQKREKFIRMPELHSGNVGDAPQCPEPTLSLKPRMALRRGQRRLRMAAAGFVFGVDSGVDQGTSAHVEPTC
jgi:hypothetical protein